MFTGENLCSVLISYIFTLLRAGLSLGRVDGMQCYRNVCLALCMCCAELYLSVGLRRHISLRKKLHKCQSILRCFIVQCAFTAKLQWRTLIFINIHYAHFELLHIKHFTDRIKAVQYHLIFKINPHPGSHLSSVAIIHRPLVVGRRHYIYFNVRWQRKGKRKTIWWNLMHGS